LGAASAACSDVRPATMDLVRVWGFRGPATQVCETHDPSRGLRSGGPQHDLSFRQAHVVVPFGCPASSEWLRFRDTYFVLSSMCIACGEAPGIPGGCAQGRPGAVCAALRRLCGASADQLPRFGGGRDGCYGLPTELEEGFIAGGLGGDNGRILMDAVTQLVTEAKSGGRRWPLIVSPAAAVRLCLRFADASAAGALRGPQEEQTDHLCEGLAAARLVCSGRSAAPRSRGRARLALRPSTGRLLAERAGAAGRPGPTHTLVPVWPDAPSSSFRLETFATMPLWPMPSTPACCPP
jgi:hypothetical protein